MSTAPAPAPLPERPMPTPTRESQPYWDGMREGRFMLQHCASCGKVRHYPRPVCPHCFSMESEFKEAPTGGTIHAWTVCHHPFNFFFKAAGALHRGAGRHGCRRARERAAARASMPRTSRSARSVRLQFEPVSKEVTLPFFVAD